MKTGDRIKKLRKECGWNQTELGIKIGLTTSGIAAIEQSRNDPSAAAIVKLTEIFNVSADYLLKGKENTETISNEEQEYLELIREDNVLAKAMSEAVNIKKKVLWKISEVAHRRGVESLAA
jgi:transcriptional regulator with XRE-family HTH domain